MFRHFWAFLKRARSVCGDSSKTRVPRTRHRQSEIPMGSTLYLLIFISLTLLMPLSAGKTQVEPAPVQVQWAIDAAPEGGWTVGDPIPLRLSVSYPGGFAVTLPQLAGSWGAFEVRSQENLDPVKDQDGSGIATSLITVTAWAPGVFDLPAIVIPYRDQEGDLGETVAPSRTVSIVSVLAEGETEKAELKPQATLPAPSRVSYYLGTLFVLAIGGVVGWTGYRYLRRRPSAAAGSSLDLNPRLPQEIAYDELERIEALDLPAQGELKLHYSLLADCVRAYVDGRYRVPAMDLTTAELAAALRDRSVVPKHIVLIREFLAQADLVKFAKFHPHVDQAYGAVDVARNIVDLTLARETADPDPPAGAVAGDSTSAHQDSLDPDARTRSKRREPLDC